METLNIFFGKIVFYKVDFREDHTIYAASLSSSYQDGKKQYAMAFVPNHLAVLSKGYLSDLNWVNLQTRTMSNGYKIQQQRWEIPKGVPMPMFTAIDREEHKTKYMCDEFPLEMILIHDPKKKSKYQYHNHINLLAALISFKCVISLLDTPMMQGRGETYPSQRITQYPVSHGEPPQSHYTPTPAPAVTTMRDFKTLGSNSMRAPKFNQHPLTTSNSMTSSVDQYNDQTTYTPVAPSHHYATIGLPDYSIPQPVPKTVPKKGMVASGNDRIDSSFELI